MTGYLDTLTLYYEEEIEGEAYFAALADRFSDDDHKRKLNLLAQVERHAADGVAPLIARHGLAPRSRAELVASGRADADATAPDWTILLDDMRATYAGFLAAFETLERLGPPEDRALLSFLTGHEVAAIRFLEIEATDPATSAAPLTDYLATSAANWPVPAD